ncbi:MAG: PEGA domain-containing protein [Spirochaetaceae bacterium]|jgi:hypothetical protein|nr:PEGA domain-containing protein [Spirochaetaceae bacterium]
MGRITLWVCLFLILPGGPGFADTYAEVEGSGLFIGSDPPGARVFINGIERGLTPFSVQSMQNGEYSIRLSKDGYVDRRFRVVIRKQSRVEVSVSLEVSRGQVLVEIRRDPAAPPFLALSPRILVDGVGVVAEGAVSGTEQSLSLPVGWRTLTVEAFGWERIGKSIYIREDLVQRLEFVLKPAVFTLDSPALKKNRVNPGNPGKLGIVELNFTVTGPGRGTLEVADSGGTVVYTQALGPFTARGQQALWNGRDAYAARVPDGEYRIHLIVWGEEGEDRQTAELPVQIDSFLELRPLSLGAGSPGLLWASVPELLPVSSFQINGSILGGKPLGQETWEGVFFTGGFRVSFTDTLGGAFVFNLDPEFSGGLKGGVGASLRWVFKPPRRRASFFEDAGAAVELSYGWAQSGPYTAFGMGTGAALRLPVSYRVLDLPVLDLFLSPRFLWAGDRGYPDSIAPRLGAEGGIYLARGIFAGGLSLRWDYALPGAENPGPGPLVSAVELKFFPSHQVLSVLGGFWFWNGERGAFFGLGIDYIY